MPDLASRLWLRAVRARQVDLGESRVPQRASPLREGAGVAEHDGSTRLSDGCATQQVIATGEVQLGIDLAQHVGAPSHSDPCAVATAADNRVVVVAERLGLRPQEDAVLAGR